MESISAPKLPQINAGFPRYKKSFNFDEYLRSTTQIGRVGRFVIDNPCDEGLHRREQLWNYQQNNRGVVTKHKIQREASAFRLTQPEVSLAEKGRKKKENGGSSNKKMFARLRLRSKLDTKTSSVLSSELDNANRSKTSPSYFNSLSTEFKSKTVNRNAEKDVSGIAPVFGQETNDKQTVSYSAERLPDLTSALTKLGYLRFTRNVVHYGGGFFGRHGDFSRSLSTISNTETPRVMLSHVLEKKAYGTFRNLEVLQGIAKEKKQSRKTYLQKREELLSCLKKTPINVDRAKQKISQNDNDDKKMSGKKQNVLRPIETPRVHKKEKDLNNNDKSDIVCKQESINEDTPMVKKLLNDNTKQAVNNNIKTQNSLLARSISNISAKNTSIARTSGKNVSSGGLKTQRSKLELSLKRTDTETSIDMPLERVGPSTHNRGPSREGQYDNYLNPYHWNTKTVISENDKHWIKKTIDDSKIIDHSNYGGFARTRPVQLPKIADSKRPRETYHD